MRWHTGKQMTYRVGDRSAAAPQTESLEDALRQLFVIGGIDRDGAITADGRAMAALPLDPALAAAALAAAELGCLPDLLTVAAMLSADSIFAGGRRCPFRPFRHLDQA